jgi:hypothetical protein
MLAAPQKRRAHAHLGRLDDNCHFAFLPHLDDVHDFSSACNLGAALFALRETGQALAAFGLA